MTAAEMDRARYMSLATFRKNGAEVATPVWFAEADLKLYVIATDDSGKVKRLRNSRPRMRADGFLASGGRRPLAS
jgi:uncharacterized protein